MKDWKMDLQIYGAGRKSAKLQKKAYAGRGHESKWEIPVDYLRTALAATFVPFGRPIILSPQNNGNIGIQYHGIDQYYIKAIVP